MICHRFFFFSFERTQKGWQYVFYEQHRWNKDMILFFSLLTDPIRTIRRQKRRRRRRRKGHDFNAGSVCMRASTLTHKKWIPSRWKSHHPIEDKINKDNNSPDSLSAVDSLDTNDIIIYFYWMTLTLSNFRVRLTRSEWERGRKKRTRKSLYKYSKILLLFHRE